MNRCKRKTTQGQLVVQAEQQLSKYNIHGSSTIQELDEIYEVHLQNRDTLRSFYYSNSNCKKKVNHEYKKWKFKDIICSEERTFVSPKSSIMFIGDRGYGTGSRIKG